MLYDFLGECSEKLFKSNPLPLELLGDLCHSFIYDGMFLIKAQGFGSGDDISNITLPAVVSIEVKEVKEHSDLVNTEDRVLGDDILSEDGFFFLLNVFSLAHKI